MVSIRGGEGRTRSQRSNIVVHRHSAGEDTSAGQDQLLVSAELLNDQFAEGLGHTAAGKHHDHAAAQQEGGDHENGLRITQVVYGVLHESCHKGALVPHDVVGDGAQDDSLVDILDNYGVSEFADGRQQAQEGASDHIVGQQVQADIENDPEDPHVSSLGFHALGIHVIDDSFEDIAAIHLISPLIFESCLSCASSLYQSKCRQQPHFAKTRNWDLPGAGTRTRKGPVPADETHPYM